MYLSSIEVQTLYKIQVIKNILSKVAKTPPVLEKAIKMEGEYLKSGLPLINFAGDIKKIQNFL